jgi:hypothetical protein
MTASRYVLVLTSAAGRRFGLRLDRTPVEGEPGHTVGGFVVDDVDAGVKIGDATPTCQPILVDIAGEQHVLFAGTADYDRQRFTALNGHRHPVREGAWMSFPEPFQPGMVVVVTGLDVDGAELFRVVSPPLAADRPTPIFGPGWTSYAPAST